METDDASVDCLCLGILVVDHACQPLDRLPRAGELIESAGLELALGGCPANAAVALSRLGLRASVVGAVGNDDLGRFITGELRRQGVAVDGIRITNVATSGTLIVNVRGEDRRFIHSMGANRELMAADVSPERLRGAKVLYVGSSLAMPLASDPALVTLLESARSLGIKTVLDCIVPPGRDYWPVLAPLLPWTDVFLPNSDEAESLTGLRDPLAQAERFVSAGATMAVVTCAALGSVMASPEGNFRAGAYPVPCQSATGAGDAFDAGFMFGLIQGLPLTECLRWGSAMGASAVRELSATAGLFDRTEAEQFLRATALEIVQL